MLRKMLWEILWEMLWEMVQEKLQEILWEMAGGMMQFFHLTCGWGWYTVYKPSTSQHV